MQVQIQTKPAFTAIGFSNQRDCSPGAIPAVWEKNGPTLAGLPSSEPGIFYGVMKDFNPADRSLDYIAAIAVAADAPVPEGMVRWDVPEQTYAVFDSTLASIADTFHAIHQTWLPSAGFQHAGGPELERYGEDFDTDDTHPLTIWIPVTPTA